MNPVIKLDGFHKTRIGYIVFAIVELGLTYIFASIAVDTASMWAYLAAIILFIGFLINFVSIFQHKKELVAEKNSQSDKKKK